MDDRLKKSLQQIIIILQESDGVLGCHRLVKRLFVKGRDEFYTIDVLLNKLKDLDYIENANDAFIKLTLKGNEFKGFENIDHQKYKDIKIENLNLENLELQNQNLKILNSSNNRQIEIDNLTIENLNLQNKQLRRHILYSIISFIAGALITNIKDIINLISSLSK